MSYWSRKFESVNIFPMNQFLSACWRYQKKFWPIGRLLLPAMQKKDPVYCCFLFTISVIYFYFLYIRFLDNYSSLNGFMWFMIHLTKHIFFVDLICACVKLILIFVFLVFFLPFACRHALSPMWQYQIVFSNSAQIGPAWK